MRLNQNLSGKQPTFRQKGTGANTYRLLILLILVVSSVFLLRALRTDQIRSPFEPTRIPTRTAGSFEMEAETRFTAGDLNGAIEAYQKALALDPKNGELWARLARIQTYSTSLLTTDDERGQRLKDALDSVNKAVELSPDDSLAHAIRAFVLDWNATSVLAGENGPKYLVEAEQEATRALQLDNQNTLALAFYAEILNDQQKWVQADQYIRQALERDSSFMDVHRINATIRETFRDYPGAIKEYETAAIYAPNMTSLYISIGINYRQLKQYPRALEYFEKAARINDQLQIKDPVPYVAIGKTYVQTGDFFIASRNMLKGLQYNPYSADLYGQLGIVYFQARNYETAITALKCAVRGCTAAESCELRRCDEAVDPQIEVKGMPLTSSTVVYYYSYGSVLTGMHRPTDDKCSEAVEVLAEVRNVFANDPSIMSIVQANERVCASFGVVYSGGKVVKVTPTAGPSPTPTQTETPTSTPKAETAIP